MRPRVSSRPPPEPGAPAEESARRVLVRIVLLVLAVRAGLQAVGLTALSLRGAGWSVRSALDLWVAWDALAYLRIAERGYPAEGEGALDIVFFPLFPVLVRLGSFVVVEPTVSALIISAAASVGAGWFLYRLVRLDASHEEAWRAVVLLLTFPTAYFLAAPYTESLFLLAVLASMYAARTGRWGWSAGAGAAATATRVTGVVLLPALALEALRTSAGLRRLLSRGALVGVAGAGLAAYLALNVAVHGNPFAFVELQAANWHNEPTWPWHPLADAVSELREGGLSEDLWIIHWGRLGGAALAAGLLAAGRRFLRPADQLYGWVGLVLLLMSTWLISLPRYLLVLYPLFLVLARLSAHRAVFWVLLISGGGLQVLLFWRYALGWWTF